LGPQLKRLPSPKKSTDDMGASREGQGILALLENVQIRFALVATFWFVQKEPKIVATTDMFHSVNWQPGLRPLGFRCMWELYCAVP